MTNSFLAIAASLLALDIADVDDHLPFVICNPPFVIVDTLSLLSSLTIPPLFVTMATGSSGVSSSRAEFHVGGKYRLVRKIGSGSFGDIYLGT